MDERERRMVQEPQAAANWPVPPGGKAPSHEEQARLVSSLNDAAAMLRVAAGSTENARDVVASKVPPASPMRAAA